MGESRRWAFRREATERATEDGSSGDVLRGNYKNEQYVGTSCVCVICCRVCFVCFGVCVCVCVSYVWPMSVCVRSRIDAVSTRRSQHMFMFILTCLCCYCTMFSKHSMMMLVVISIASQLVACILPMCTSIHAHLLCRDNKDVAACTK